MLSGGAVSELLAPHVTRDEIIMMRASSCARRLYAINTRPASTTAGATFNEGFALVLDRAVTHSTPSGRRPARGSEATGRVVSHGLFGETGQQAFTVVRPWYGLSTLSMTTLGYARGPSDGGRSRGSARRESIPARFE